MIQTLILAPWAQAAPNSLQDVLLQADAQGHLPLEFALATLPRLRIHVHQVDGFRPAVFARQQIPLLEAQNAVDPQSPQEPQKPNERRAAGETPTLYLDSRSYLRDGQWLALADQPLDTSEALFNALLLADLELQEVGRDSGYAATMRRRAKALLGTIPADYQLEAYLHGVADFGSHALSVANELERVALRHRRRGTDICLHFDRRASLFGLWDGIFNHSFYQARYFEPAQGDSLVGRPVDTGIGIATEDKRLFQQAVFKNFWTGDRLTDLGRRLCPQRIEPVPAGGRTEKDGSSGD